jgi:hypothetical protein
MKKIIALLVFGFNSILPLTALNAADSVPAKAVALKMITAYFLDGNTKEALKFVAGEAQRKDQGPGSALRIFQSRPPSGLSPGEIIFFQQSEIAELQKRFPDDMWQARRIPAHIKDGLGCLMVMSSADKEKTGLVAFVIHKREDGHKVTYTDDN